MVFVRLWPRKLSAMKAVLDHVGIAVADLAAALALLSRCPRPGRRCARGCGRVSACARTSLPAGRASLELLEATAPDSPIARFLEKRGPGLHHITLRVDDIGAALAQLQGPRRQADRRATAAGRRRRAGRVHPPVERAGRPRRAQAISRVGARPRLGAGHSRYTLGDLELISVNDGFFRLDGGAMFGVVPKTLWAPKAPPDERNRILLAMRPLVVRGARTMIIDAGAGRQGEPEVPRHLRRRSARGTWITRSPRRA